MVTEVRMEGRVCLGRIPKAWRMTMAKVCVASMNWANCQKVMKMVVVRETERRETQPGLGRRVVRVTASTCARQTGKAKRSLRGGVHMTLVASPWLKKKAAVARMPPSQEWERASPRRNRREVVRPASRNTTAM